MNHVVPVNKGMLRKRLRLERRSLSPSCHRIRSARAACVVLRLPAFKSGARIAIYHSFDGETSTKALLAGARRRGVRLYVPRVSDVRHRKLRFVPASADTRRGRYGIRIPRRSGAPVSARWFDLIVVPLVGVDVRGRRLGMGGGFYDRALDFRRRRRCWFGPRLIGLCFDCQRVSTVHADPWDMTLDAVATESGVHTFERTT